ncbi:MAG: CoA ester lyase [Deferribacterota bacterium]|nr:CoA ester lyase [Deferribacterota bacterium]
MRLYRSFLFVPGNNEKRIRKALSSEADAIIIDLEDAVATNEKDSARDIALRLSNEPRKKPLYIRINSLKSPYFEKDIECINTSNIDGVILPKCEKGEDVTYLVNRLKIKLDIIPLIESAKGVINSQNIAASSENISRLAFGAIDYTLDIEAIYSKTGKELLYPRSKLVLSSKVANLFPPVDTVFPDLEDETSLALEIEEAKILGMFGKLAIHPKQLPIINNNFTPSEKEIEEAKKVVEIFEKSEKEGTAAIEVDGKFVDYPVYKRSKNLLNLINNFNQE